ncbi:MAG: glutamate racemase [Treponema sp.]|jgi:glutamate racemase|nr:glutamate racemase [Treponema sp.]
MDNRPVLFFDSGAGGLPYCQSFRIRNPAEAVVYAADRANFPYGPKDREDLIRLCIALVSRMAELFNPKLAAVVCNTASVSALEALRDTFPAIPFVGTVPAVKPAVLASRKRHIGVLGTSRTIGDPYLAELAARYGPDCAVTGIAAPELVDFVERRYEQAGGEERRRMAASYIERFRAAGADGVVLGCTHFLFLLDEFKAAAGEPGPAEPAMGIYDSVEGVSRRIEALLDGGGLRAEPAAAECAGNGSGRTAPAAGILVISGSAPPGVVWQKRADAFGLELRRLADIGPGEYRRNRPAVSP